MRVETSRAEEAMAEGARAARPSNPQRRAAVDAAALRLRGKLVGS